MLFRNCAGGVVFYGNKVLLLKNEKHEWILPKGIIKAPCMPTEVAVNRVKEEAGVTAQILSTAGQTSYEFYSISRKTPVCNEIIWYIMESVNNEYKINKEYGFLDGGFYKIKEALEMITYSQDKSLVNLSFQKYKLLKREAVII